MADSFPRQNARTRNFTLGHPRTVTVTGGGGRIYFLRSRHGEDTVNCLWRIDITNDQMAAAVLVADPLTLAAGESGELPAEERRRRERLRERSAGITSYSVSKDGQRVVFALNGDLYLAPEKPGRQPARVLKGESAYDPRLSPDGHYVAYISGGALGRLDVSAAEPQVKQLAKPDVPHVTWGVADFVAAEEMDRQRGYWWSPDSTRLIAARVDNQPVTDWFISDPSNPAAAPTTIKYPAAGTANAGVTLSLIDAASGDKTAITWDHRDYPYLVAVRWASASPLIVVQSRDQTRIKHYLIDPVSGDAQLQAEQKDPRWIEIHAGLPAQFPDGQIVDLADTDVRHLTVNGKAVTPPHLNVRQFSGRTDDGTLIFEAWDPTPRSWQVWAVAPEGKPTQLTRGEGVHGATVGGSTVIIHENTLSTCRYEAPQVHLWMDGALKRIGEIATHAAVPPLQPRPAWLTSTKRHLEAAVILPEHYDGTSPLPVLMSPYGGPHAQYAVAASHALLSAQWFANAGFAVIVADGRGAPGRGPAWEKAIHRDLLNPAIEDQVEALQTVLAKYPQLDSRKVAIRGWSFGGYLAAAAVIFRPDIFAAAIAGAPVSDWRLYDTHYSERYLGDPQANPAVYDQTSLLTAAARLERPLQIIHGLADDNVVVAHSLRLSGALLAAGRPHEVLPLSGVTHMTPQEEVAENLLKLQLDFLRRHLDVIAPEAAS
ncbi:MAG: peptidase dipeptidylpeptidase protein [Patescibacteria group bacterium]|nr:peptidase dipeptidylpeptidase protein [Patescibacteria group bacterium]